MTPRQKIDKVMSRVCLWFVILDGFLTAQTHLWGWRWLSISFFILGICWCVVGAVFKMRSERPTL